MGRARKRTDEKAALAALDRVAQGVSELLASGLPEEACELALNRLVPAARDHLDQHRSMTASVPNTLWSCGDAAVSAEVLDVTAPLWLGAARCAIFVEGGGSRRELVCSAHEMTIGALRVVLTLAEEMKPLNDLDAETKLQMIGTMSWPYLWSPKETFRGTAELISMFYRLDEQGPRLLAVGLGAGALDLEPFVPPQDLDGRLAAQETRFWLATVMSGTEPIQYARVDEVLRLGIRRIIEMDRPGVAVDGASLARSLNVLKFLLFATGNISPLVTLEMAFDGLDEIEQLKLDLPDHPLFRAAMRSRIPLHGRVGSGFGLRLDGLIKALDTNERTPIEDLVRQAFPDGPD